MKKRAPSMYMTFMILVAFFLAGCEKKEPEPESTTGTDYGGNVYAIDL
jgi:hypothetical protein